MHPERNIKFKSISPEYTPIFLSGGIEQYPFSSTQFYCSHFTGTIMVWTVQSIVRHFECSYVRHQV